MSNQLDIAQFKKTKIIKKLSKSKSNENLKDIADAEPNVVEAVDTALKLMEATTEKKRGRKSKYNNDEERKQARRQQQKEYRARKKKELEDLKKLVEQKSLNPILLKNTNVHFQC